MDVIGRAIAKAEAELVGLIDAHKKEIIEAWETSLDEDGQGRRSVTIGLRARIVEKAPGHAIVKASVAFTKEKVSDAIEIDVFDQGLFENDENLPIDRTGAANGVR